MKELYNRYKEVSLNIIQEIENDNLNRVNILMNTRKELLKIIEETVNKVELEKHYSEMMSLDNEIKNSIVKSKEEVKRELITLKKQKSANSIYGKQFSDIYFINKQI